LRAQAAGQALSQGGLPEATPSLTGLAGQLPAQGMVTFGLAFYVGLIFIITVFAGPSSQPSEPALQTSTPTPPIHTLYQSARLLPQLPSNPPSTLQPFLGFSSLAPPAATQQANHAHLASASATIPHQQQVPCRGVRRHTSSQAQRSAAPTLGHRSGKAKIEDCLIDPEGSEELIHIQVRVYPPVVCITSLGSHLSAHDFGSLLDHPLSEYCSKSQVNHSHSFLKNITCFSIMKFPLKQIWLH
jgi:hypothetical protein